MKTIAQVSIDTLALVDILKGAATGDVIPYSEMTKAISRDVQNEGRGNMETARRILMKEKNMVFDAVHGVGLKRVDSSGMIVVAQAITRKIHRASRRGVQVLSCADYDTLPKELKAKHNANMAALGMLNAVTKTSSMKKLEAKVDKDQQRLSLAATLDAFKS